MTVSVRRLSLVSNNLTTTNDFTDSEETDNLCCSDTDKSPFLGTEVSCAADQVLWREVEVLDCGRVAENVDQRLKV